MYDTLRHQRKQKKLLLNHLNECDGMLKRKKSSLFRNFKTEKDHIEEKQQINL